LPLYSASWLTVSLPRLICPSLQPFTSDNSPPTGTIIVATQSDFAGAEKMSMKSNALSIKEKIGYGMGDAGCNMIGGAIMLFLNYFYTDI
jgi:hypothetical protein